MALFAYPSEMMKEDAKAQGVNLTKVDEFCAEVEKSQSTSTFDRFPPPYLTRKRIWSYNNRRIASVGDSRVQDRLVYLPDLLLEVADGDDRGPQIATARSDSRLRMAYRWFPAEQQLFLMDVAYGRHLDAGECYAECMSKVS